MMHLVTGYAGKEHITSADQGSFNAAVMGAGEFVLEGGEQFRCQVISNNKVRIYDGEALMQGRHIKSERNTYEETTHDNGTQGYQRIDLVVLTYTKDATTGIENVTMDVIKGTPSASNPDVPEYVTGDILNLGDLKNQMPLYKIPFDGLSIGEPVAMFKTISALETMKAEVDAEAEAKKAELDAKFEELEGGIEDKIAEAGKPLSSNADDWALIENYDEYSADAKTVGEEFAKVKDNLGERPQFVCDEITGEIIGYTTKIGGADTVFPFSSGGSFEEMTINTFVDTHSGKSDKQVGTIDVSDANEVFINYMNYSLAGNLTIGLRVYSEDNVLLNTIAIGQNVQGQAIVDVKDYDSIVLKTYYMSSNAADGDNVRSKYTILCLLN